jgi:TnpA family transposase
MNTALPGATYKELAYVRKRYLNVDGLRNANGIISNGTLSARNPSIWDDGTTACASDSKHYRAWDQNLTSQWHMRYGGRGVMIYWHVERKSLCIHSQLKSPSSSEVSSMIEASFITSRKCRPIGNTSIATGKARSPSRLADCSVFSYSHGSKAIHKQRLRLPDETKADTYKNLRHVLTRSIRWDLIRQQYDQMVKYATALRLGTARTEALLRRFTRNNVQHPTYKALAELGKAVKTIFLCRYLHSEALRREINEGLNIVEQWNGATDFVFFAKRGEFTSNRREDHEISALCLHLLQNCMVYINTLNDTTRPCSTGMVPADDTPRLPSAHAACLGARQPLRPLRTRYERSSRALTLGGLQMAPGGTSVG